MTYGWVVDPDSGDKVDQVYACYFKAPNSYTGEDTIEIFCHASQPALIRILKIILSNGAQIAEPGEYSKKAYLKGKIDLAQAESICDLAQAKTEKVAGFAVQQLSGRLSKTINELKTSLIKIASSIEAAIDFSDEVSVPPSRVLVGQVGLIIARINKLLLNEKVSRLFREGGAVAIVGRPNVGKSSLLNALLNEDRAIVTPLPGTTRDSIEEFIEIDGLPLKLIDTAGLRKGRNQAEKFGVGRSYKEIECADLILFVVDGSKMIGGEELRIGRLIENRPTILVVNKIDKKRGINGKTLMYLAKGRQKVEISAKYGQGVSGLRRAIARSLVGRAREGFILLNERHQGCLRRARERLLEVCQGIHSNDDLDCLALKIKSAIIPLGEISGELVSEEIINQVFSKFCVGK